MQTTDRVRLIAFVSVLILMAVLETVWPRRKRTANRLTRTVNNLLLSALNTAALHVLPALSAVLAAQFAVSHGMGILPLLKAPYALSFPLTLLIYDLLIFWQHRFMHAIPLLWRLHKVHHLDLDLDASSGVRFHTIEIILSMGIKCLAALALGPPPLAVAVFEMILNALSIFSHANLYLPEALDRILRLAFVTPDMHRIHHSVLLAESNHNYGFCLSLWDKVFRTYLAEPSRPQDQLALGVQGEQTPAQSIPLLTMLRAPFLASTNKITRE